MLAALVFQEKNKEDPPLTSRMEVARQQMKDIMQGLTVLQESEGVVIDADSKPSLNFGLSAVVYQWARLFYRWAVLLYL
jgi:superfamily II RNA helicase